MPLIRDEGVSAHSWRFAEADDTLENRGHLIVTIDRLDEALDAQNGGPLGLVIDNDVDATSLVPAFALLELIAIRFPGFADGRGFSLARRLRDLGFTGEIWAAGHLIADQYAFARSCGFDAVLVDDGVYARQSEADWLHAATSLSLSYQTGTEVWNGGPRSILDLRRAARVSIAAE